MKEDKIYFKVGDEVAHKDNLDLKTEVSRILKEWRTIHTDFGNSKSVEKKCFIIGIECSWWDGQKRCMDRFHSKTLIPWSIVEEGFIAVQKYLN